LSGASLAKICSNVGGEYLGTDVPFGGVVLDTREQVAGRTFVAIKGAKQDGHDFIQEAEEKGANSLIVSRRVESNLPCIIVPDPKTYLADMAKWWRRQFSLPMVGITGSCGKTTVKEMLASILQQNHNVLVTQGNRNNELGVPITLLDLNDQHTAAVIEMGACRPNDIAYLMEIAKPKYTTITCVTGAHLEIFGSIENIAKTKGEIFACLDSKGVAAVNMDDRLVAKWNDNFKGTVITYGMEADAKVTASYVADCEQGLEFGLVTPIGNIDIQLNLLGEHNIQNALAASALAISMGTKLDTIRAGLRAYVGTKGRLLQRKGRNGALVIDDSYNAIPYAVRAAIKVLAKFSSKKILVLGDMLEIGPEETNEHLKIGEYARSLGIDNLLTYGRLSRHAKESFGDGSFHFEQKGALINHLKAMLDAKTTVLIKGSNSMKMSEVVDAID